MEDNNTQVYTLSTETIATIAQLLQMAMLTGTDLFDHLKTLQLISKDGSLHVSPEFQQRLTDEIGRLSAQVETLSAAPLQFGFQKMS